VTIRQSRQVLRGSDEGESLWLLGGLYTFRATNAETGLYTMVEVKGPEKLAIPVHYHEGEDEGFYVARGQVMILIGDEERTLAAGGFALAPSGVRHTFRLETPDATLLLLVSPGPAHEAMFRDMGEPATARSIPEPSAVSADPAALAEVAARYGTQIVGPPPRE